MDQKVSLPVGSFVVELKDSADDELLAVFLGGMLQHREARAGDYRPRKESNTPGIAVTYPDDYDDQTVEVVEFRAPGEIIADRLDLMGFDPASTLACLDDLFRESLRGNLPGEDDADRIRIAKETEYLESLNGKKWVEELRSASDDGIENPRLTPGSRSWLLGQIKWLSERVKLRAYLLAFPDSEVILDVTDQWPQWWELESQAASLPSISTAKLVGTARGHAPIVVLTEGSTDTEFLREALRVLYPHLTDLIKFLDYSQRPEGSASALARTVKAFAAAGIVNRVVAVFDNDTAGRKELLSIDQASLPDHIKVIQYPDLDLANEYPTFGPPTLDSPQGSESLANINGSGASIELYLGRDILTREDGSLRPIQWKSESWPGGEIRYQGEIIDKTEVQRKFREKYRRADLNDDWTGLKLVLDAIRQEAQSIFIEDSLFGSTFASAFVNRAIPEG